MKLPRGPLSKLALVYGPPSLLLLFHISLALNALGFVPWLGSRVLIDKIEYSYLGIYFLAAAIVFYKSFREAPSGVLRQQLKWLTGGTLAGALPFALLYVIPFVLDAVPPSWTKFSALSLVLIPLCFGYAIIRYRLNGRGHHLQARLGIHGRHRSRRLDLFRADRVDR